MRNHVINRVAKIAHNRKRLPLSAITQKTNSKTMR